MSLSEQQKIDIAEQQVHNNKSIKNILKKIILPFLHFIRKMLSVLKNHCLPFAPPSHYSVQSAYERYQIEEIEKSYNFFKKYFNSSLFFDDANLHREYAILEAKRNNKINDGYFLEFGVGSGSTINFFSKYVDKIYGFDSFLGLSEDWKGGYLNHSIGKFSRNGKIPKVNDNVILIKGIVQDTLLKFLNEKKPKIVFTHLDVDTYESTNYILRLIKPFLLNNAILHFDEFYDFPGWSVGEFKAFSEQFKDNEYEYLAFNRYNHLVTIKNKKLFD